MRNYVGIFTALVASTLILTGAGEYAGLPDARYVLKRPFCNSYGCRNGKRTNGVAALSTRNPYKPSAGSTSAQQRYKQSREIYTILKLLTSPKYGDTAQSRVGRQREFAYPTEVHATRASDSSERQAPNAVRVAAKRPFCNHFGCANGKRDDSRAVARSLGRWLAYMRTFASPKKRNERNWKSNWIGRYES